MSSLTDCASLARPRGSGIQIQVSFEQSYDRVFYGHSIVCSFRSIDERTLVYFADNPRHLLEAYVENGEGSDRAGGFAVQVIITPYPPMNLGYRDTESILSQGLGGILVRKIDGDYQNVVRFPAASFFKFFELLCEEEDDFLEL